MATRKRKELASLPLYDKLAPEEKRPKGWRDRLERQHAGNERMLEWIRSLRPVSCLGCGKVKYTAHGKPFTCPRCSGKKGTVEQPSVPMGRQLR